MRTLFFIAALLCLWGCKKTYEFAGTVYDATTGKPLAGADCGLTMVNKTAKERELVPGSKVRTDSTGTFYLFGESQKADIGYFQVYKFGYITYKRQFDGGGTLDDDIYMYKFDAHLEVTFENTSTDTRKLWYALNYQSIGAGVECTSDGCTPLTISGNTSRKTVVKVPGGLDVNFIWQEKSFGITAFNENLLHTKVFCTSGDTTRITIPF